MEKAKSMSKRQAKRARKKCVARKQNAARQKRAQERASALFKRATAPVENDILGGDQPSAGCKNRLFDLKPRSKP